MLKERLEQPLYYLSQWSVDGSCAVSKENSILNHPAAKKGVKRCNELLELIQEFDKKVYDEWMSEAAQQAVLNLKTPVLSPIADSSSQFDYPLIQVNFDPKLVTLLREVKYFKLMNLSIPDEAQSLFDEGSKFRHWIASLTDASRNYNSGMMQVRPSDFNVFKPLMDLLYHEVDRLCRDVLWVSDGASNAIAGIVKKSTMFMSLVSNLLSNEAKVLQSIEQLNQKPIVFRKKGKVFRINSTREVETLLAKVSSNFPHFTTCSESVTQILNQSFLTLSNSKEDNFELVVNEEAWQNYLNFVTDKVAEKLESLIINSLQHLLDQFKVPVPLVVPELVIDRKTKSLKFYPGEENDDVSLLQIFQSITETVVSVGDYFKCPNNLNETATFLEYLSKSAKISDISDSILNNVTSAVTVLKSIKHSFNQYSWLWTVSPS
ncbi:hypothetical protein GEMRC1_005041 [Eukaryota sp. GEM-RC1]